MHRGGFQFQTSRRVESSKRRQFPNADCVCADAELNHQFQSHSQLLVNAIILLLPFPRRISHFTNGDKLKAKELSSLRC